MGIEHKNYLDLKCDNPKCGAVDRLQVTGGPIEMTPPWLRVEIIIGSQTSRKHSQCGQKPPVQECVVIACGPSCAAAWVHSWVGGASSRLRDGGDGE